ncbi:MAG: DUF3306 domain-containing protein [Thiohalophilus sp.]|uniref:DUF3306 domain-containing protein n=1 Tax=Thiohalophilus sp. TaxID=3028392 RepID=UPI00286FB476|nr:DUF3306 domain-containing protein [Thiohalophilus sp.]MDR9436848.1 DUF3306 domain-containing protein [Thiohalophilus sp.]
MSDSNDTGNDQDRSFLHRWSRRKHDHSKPEKTKMQAPALADAPPVVEPPGSQEVPDVDTLGENSEVSMFFSEQVSETLKRQALRKLFHMNKFNFCDGLDDYAEDYTLFEPLGNTITAHQRLQEERQAIKQLVSDDELPPVAENEPHEPETTLQADNTDDSVDEYKGEPAPVDQPELKEG